MKKVAIYNPYLETKGGGEKVCLALAEALARDKNTEVLLITHDKVDLKPLEQYFDVDLSRVKLFIVRFDGFFMKLGGRMHLPGAVNNLLHDLKVYWAVRKGNFDTFINNCYQSNLPGPSKNNVYMCMFPQMLTPNRKNVGTIKSIYQHVMRAAYRVMLHPGKSHAVFTYDLITANSEYTQGYIKKYWGLDSEILYPICEDMQVSDVPKQKKILTVGRFFENNGDNHHKKQDVLVQAFADMKDLHKDGWELHLAGSVAEDVGALRYILSLLKIADGTPVFFHFNCSFPELKKLYNEASLYWHATGYGSDPDKKPEKQEHFGITTVEAMSTGCIPVVINSAGQRETVVEAQNGYLWSIQKELIEKTTRLANGKVEIKELEQAARTSASAYFKPSFEKRCIEIFKKSE